MIPPSLSIEMLDFAPSECVISFFQSHKTSSANLQPWNILKIHVAQVTFNNFVPCYPELLQGKSHAV